MMRRALHLLATAPQHYVLVVRSRPLTQADWELPLDSSGGLGGKRRTTHEGYQLAELGGDVCTLRLRELELMLDRACPRLDPAP
eukprot:SAG25_NODE_191_length_12265_cov_16.310538_10_plen_84_part_00